MTMYSSLIKYINAGRLLHFIALLDFIISAIAVGFIISLNGQGDEAGRIVWVTILLLFGGMSIYAELDGYSRFQNYKKVKDQLYLNGYQKRILMPLAHSRCQRDAAQLACDELGIGDTCKSYFQGFGYKWYHIIPDFVFKNPSFFFTTFFWRKTFFTPYYEPKVNFRELDPRELDSWLKNLQLGPAT